MTIVTTPNIRQREANLLERVKELEQHIAGLETELQDERQHADALAEALDDAWVRNHYAGEHKGEFEGCRVQECRLYNKILAAHDARLRKRRR